jgi:hypothetical protein
MTFYNVRAYSNIGSMPMPESKPMQARHRGRIIEAQTRLDGSVDLGDIPGMMRRATMIELADDGLSAYEVVLGPGTGLEAEAVAGSGRFYIVLRGAMWFGDRDLQADGVAFVSPGDSSPFVRSGADGVHFLQLQLPCV